MAILPACSGTARPPVPPPSVPVEVRGGDSASLSLEEKASELEALIGVRHLTPEGLLAYGIGLASPESDEVLGMGYADMAIWSGCYLAAQAFRYAVTGDPAAKGRAARLVEGLVLLQEVNGVPGLLSRAVRRWEGEDNALGAEWHRGVGPFSDYQWLGDVSADQVDGVIFGYSVAYELLDDKGLKGAISGQVALIADHVIRNGMRIVDIDGEQTKHGDFTTGLLAEPLNALIALALVKSAMQMTGDDRFSEAYRFLVEEKKYHKRAVKARDPWWELFTGVNHSDNNLAFLAYYTLMRSEEDPDLLSYYRKSLERAWNVVRSEGNPLFSVIYHALTPEKPGNARAMSDALQTLRLYPADRRNWPRDPDELAGLCVAFRSDRFGRKQSCEPVPMNLRPPDVFEWKENPYRIETGGDGRQEYSGVDYLLPYWMGTFHGFIPIAS